VHCSLAAEIIVYAQIWKGQERSSTFLSVLVLEGIALTDTVFRQELHGGSAKTADFSEGRVRYLLGAGIFDNGIFV
jgi:hypothetical protein